MVITQGFCVFGGGRKRFYCILRETVGKIWETVLGSQNTLKTLFVSTGLIKLDLVSQYVINSVVALTYERSYENLSSVAQGFCTEICYLAVPVFLTTSQWNRTLARTNNLNVSYKLWVIPSWQIRISCLSRWPA